MNSSFSGLAPIPISEKKLNSFFSSISNKKAKKFFKFSLFSFCEDTLFSFGKFDPYKNSLTSL